MDPIERKAPLDSLQQSDALVPLARAGRLGLIGDFHQHAGNFAQRRGHEVAADEGHDVARCTVARLMRSLDLQGVIRGKPVRTTISDKAT